MCYTTKDFEKLAEILKEAERIGMEDEERRRRLGIDQGQDIGDTDVLET